MQQFIRYLYEYRQGRRMRNVGFVKVEKGERECALHIHGRGMRPAGEGKLFLYLFYEENGKSVCVPQTEISAPPLALHFRWRFTGEQTGEPENYGRINGLILVGEDERRFAASWDERDVKTEDMQMWQPEKEPERESREEEPEASEASEAPQEEEAWEPEEELREEVLPEPETSRTAEILAGEMPPRRKYTVTKIQRKELTILPRCEWQAANNNFLLHGYYNYRYLMLIDDGTVLKLGVPGIYHEKEAKAAAGFGFPEFIDEAETKPYGEGGGSDSGQRFGYWCRQVRRPAR